MGQRQYGFGIVGCGVIAPTHALALASLPNARLAAVTDTVRERGKAIADEHGAAFDPDLATLLGRREVDVVSVCVPSGLHAEVGLRAAAAGKHLVVEKPLEVSLAAADRLLAAVERAGVGLTVISQHRFDPGLLELRSLVDQGRLGRLVLGDAYVKWYRSQEYYDSGDWRGTWALDGGGALMNQGIHYVDLLRWIMGPVSEVTALCATQDHLIEVEDVALALVRFKSGAVGIIEASTAVFPGLPERLEVTGTRGTVIVEVGETRVRELVQDHDEAGRRGEKAEVGSAPVATGAADPRAIRWAGHAAQVADFLSALDCGKAPLVTGADGRAALEVVLSVYESARQGAPVTLPLGKS